MKKENKAVFAADRCYKITHSLTGKLLTAKDDGTVSVNAAEKGDSQKWIIKEENGALSLISKLTGKALDIVWAGTENGSRLHQWEPCVVPSQRWSAEKLAASTYKLISLHAGKCADVEGISAENGAAVQLWDDLGGENQMWKITVFPAAAKKSAVKTAKTVAEAKKAPAKTAKPAAEAKATAKTAKPAAEAKAPAKTAKKTKKK